MKNVSDTSLMYNNQLLTLERDLSVQPAIPLPGGTIEEYHHYVLPETGEKISFCNELFVNVNNPADLAALMQEYGLEQKGMIGDAYVLALTANTQGSPVQLANVLSADARVSCAEPHMLVDLRLPPLDFGDKGPKFDAQRMSAEDGITTPLVGEAKVRPDVVDRQWHMDASKFIHPDVVANAGVDVPAAWQLLGHKGDVTIVGAVLDDGYPLKPLHEGLIGIVLHKDMFNFASFNKNDRDPSARNDDFHGTCVLGVTVSVSENCTFQLARMGFGPQARQTDIVEMFSALSGTANTVNCSFGFGPSSIDRIPQAVKKAVTQMTLTGGADGRGLLICFAAGNENSPVYLAGKDNINGVRDGFTSIPRGKEVFAGYPNIPGVLVVGATDSMAGMASYSSWRGDVADEKGIRFVSAPSSNGRKRGLGQFTMTNQKGQGDNFMPIAEQDDPSTPFNDNHWTADMGGTSGATPLTMGVALLVKSEYPALGAYDVMTVLEAAATKDLSGVHQNKNDPNHQGLSVDFNFTQADNQSLFYGHGKVNAYNSGILVKKLKELDQTTPAPAHNTPAREEQIRTVAKQLWLDGDMRAMAGQPSAKEIANGGGLSR